MAKKRGSSSGHWGRKWKLLYNGGVGFREKKVEH